VNRCGLSFISPIKGVDISMTCIIKGRRFRERYEFCLEQGNADANLIAKWKRLFNLNLVLGLNFLYVYCA
jgi:hypothetical protein